MKRKKLTIEHLAPYLPYGVKAKTKRSEFIVVGAHDYTVFGDNENGEVEEYYEDVKLVLRPLSDLTKEIEHNGKRFVPYYWFGMRGINIESVKDERWHIVQRLISWHFDIHKLIDSGLAIDINTLKS